MSLAHWYCLDCLTSFESDIAVCSNLSCQVTRPINGWERILQPNQLLDRRFLIHRLLAIGGAGITYLAREVDDSDKETGPLLAIKVLFTGRDSGSYLHRLSNEAQILEQLAHQHIIEYRGFSHISGRAPYLITRFATGGSLMDHLRQNGPISPKAGFAIGAQICSALTEAHKLGVIHRDLKPDNILLARTTSHEGPFHALLADFGIAKVETAIHSQMTSLGTFVGTPNYAAPEQFLAQNISPSIDVYATAALLFHALTGQYVFKFSRRLGHSKIIETLQQSLPPKLPQIKATDAERQILEQIFNDGLQFDYRKRATLEDIYRLCMKGTEVSFRSSLSLSKPPVDDSSVPPIIEIINEKTSGEVSIASISTDEIYSIPPELDEDPIDNTLFNPEAREGWQIPEPQYTVIPPDSGTDQASVEEPEQEVAAQSEESPDIHIEPKNEGHILDEKAAESKRVDELLSEVSELSTIDFPKDVVDQLVKEDDFDDAQDGSIQPPVVNSEVSTSKKGLVVVALIVLCLIIGGASLFGDDNLSKPEPDVVNTVDPEVEAQLIADKMVALNDGIKQRCQIDSGRIEMRLELNAEGNVTRRMAVSSSPSLDVDCIYNIISSRTFERQSSAPISIKYKAAW